MKIEPGKILMCPPEFFSVDYEINPWMHSSVMTDSALAEKQWQNLYGEIKKILPNIELIKPQHGLPDLVFIDAGFLYKNVFIPSNFRFPERQNESAVFADWFASNEYEIRTADKELYFEGHGDNLWADEETVFCGYGFRSLRASFENIRSLLRDKGDIKMHFVQLVDPRFYHLDTCFTPLRKNLAMIYPEAVSSESLKLLERQMQLICVEEKDALQFACNTVVLGDHLIMPGASKELKETLKNYGFHVHVVEVGEFMKAGGACKCMAMAI